MISYNEKKLYFASLTLFPHSISFDYWSFIYFHNSEKKIATFILSPIPMYIILCFLYTIQLPLPHKSRKTK